ncbi:L-2-hydroxyglutarate oxidase [Vibrio sp. 10N.261.55.A7]|uniref:L-2-hydroxyglutarate oxidase n=1 Tax=Vibrio sp. 10N.261.55.A7 TaxID=1880851 RepID=UPI000C85D292|nr:L-2-hydroxyglutarate oxidase [Vibrio sp. 10N.261.55.A7]PMJ99977.1 hydroxyglutarate oxidase [Vibrio sp. 10N.261.55.A7]
MYDFIVIGGGIVGLSTALQLLKDNPGKKVVVIEKESKLASHQTGHNSGVIHAGIYYEPGSLKAKFCRQGLEDTISFCKENNIPYEQCGKLLVATNSIELERMDALFVRALTNGLEVEKLDKAQLEEAESNISGLGAIYLRSTSIVDYVKLCYVVADKIKKLDGLILLNTKVKSIYEDENKVEVQVSDTDGRKLIEGNFLVSCAGLMADRIVRMIGIKPDFQIIPYRGEYYQLPPTHNDVVKHLIYPIPDPDLPFLGVHLTKMIDGTVTVGPNAVQGWKREGYGKINISLVDSFEMLTFSGFWKVTFNNLRTGLSEFKDSLHKNGYLQRVKKYLPSIKASDLRPYPAGVRAQAVMNDGRLVHDFLFKETTRSLHVCNAPSPAATSAFPIGSYISNKATQKSKTLK